MATRARTATGRILHWRANPPRVEVTCIICWRTVMKCKSDLRPGQQTTSCGPACADLARMLWGFGSRASTSTALSQSPVQVVESCLIGALDFARDGWIVRCAQPQLVLNAAACADITLSREPISAKGERVDPGDAPRGASGWGATGAHDVRRHMLSQTEHRALRAQLADLDVKLLRQVERERR